MAHREHKIPCPKCGQFLRHRALSGLHWCANPDCPDYKGVPPIRVRCDARGHIALTKALGDEGWKAHEKEKKEQRNEQ